ncbi:MAG: hypothetical protein ACFWTZ_01005 [Burkholderia sp.]
MTTLTKLLPADAAPAKPILDRAQPIVLTSAQRMSWGDAFETEGGKVAVAVEEKRPLHVNDVFLDDAGKFWVVRPAVEKVLHVSGDLRTMQEAAAALINRGVEVAEAPEGFAVLPLPNLEKMLRMIGLETTEVEEAFEPVRIERRHGCCGHHHHHHGEGECGCGCGHDHEHEEDECCCGHDHHHDDDECCCGHDHEHEEGECCCGHDHHHDDDECCCGHDHEHEEGECCCGHDHHHDDDECCCGHDHHHEEGECGCGHHHHHGEGESCSCGK